MAYQSSVYIDSQGSYSADLANDGRYDSIRDNKFGCSHSRRETNPWWAVDLGRPTTVYRVDLTNRGDSPGVLCMLNNCLEWDKRVLNELIPRSHLYCLSLPLCLEWYNGSIAPWVHSGVTKRTKCRLYYRPSNKCVSQLKRNKLGGRTVV